VCCADVVVFDGEVAAAAGLAALTLLGLARKDQLTDNGTVAKCEEKFARCCFSCTAVSFRFVGVLEPSLAILFFSCFL
jgi:hypothetical protein